MGIDLFSIAEINWDFAQMTNHYGSSTGGGVSRGLAPSVAVDNQLQTSSQSSTARFNRTVVAAAAVLPYISGDDCPQPLAQSLWPSDCPDLGLGLPGGTGFDGTVHCRGDTFLPIGDLRGASMMVNPAAASEYFQDLSALEHPGPLPAASLFFPSSQSNIPCDQGMVIHADGQCRYPIGELLYEDAVNMGPSQQSLQDDFYFNDGSSRTVLPPKWSTSGHMTSIHQLATSSTTPFPYYQSLQCRPQQTSMKTEHSVFLSPSSTSSSSSDLLPLFVLTSTTPAIGVYNEYPQEQQQQHQQQQQQHQQQQQQQTTRAYWLYRG